MLQVSSSCEETNGVDLIWYKINAVWRMSRLEASLVIPEWLSQLRKGRALDILYIPVHNSYIINAVDARKTPQMETER